ncbi:MAG: MarR family winged helix-turn-helix transcriptional regulator [Shimia sp.]
MRRCRHLYRLRLSMTRRAFDVQDFLPYLLARAADRTSRKFEATYKARYGMLRTEWRVLFHLGRFGAMTATEICRRADLHKTKVSRALSALEAKRFVARGDDFRDRRRAPLRLTRTGAEAYACLVEEAARFDAALLATLDGAETEALRDRLRTLGGIHRAEEGG